MDEFQTCYQLWLKECRKELKQKVQRGLWPWETSAISKCEIWESGQVRMRGTMIIADRWVTAWEDSPHYRDYRTT